MSADDVVERAVRVPSDSVVLDGDLAIVDADQDEIRGVVLSPTAVAVAATVHAIDRSRACCRSWSGPPCCWT